MKREREKERERKRVCVRESVSMRERDLNAAEEGSIASDAICGAPFPALAPRLMPHHRFTLPLSSGFASNRGSHL